jgi:hypothetical protein
LADVEAVWGSETIGVSMTVPKNVLRFEVLFYLSILLDLLLAVLLHREQLTGLSAAAGAIVGLILMIVLVPLCGLVYVAARKRKNWARWVLLCWQMLSAFLSLREYGLGATLAIDLPSALLAVAGLYFSFTGDAKGWFDG